jgi:hypothetical protein
MYPGLSCLRYEIPSFDSGCCLNWGVRSVLLSLDTNPKLCHLAITKHSILQIVGCCFCVQLRLRPLFCKLLLHYKKGRFLCVSLLQIQLSSCEDLVEVWSLCLRQLRVCCYCRPSTVIPCYIIWSALSDAWVFPSLPLSAPSRSVSQSRHREPRERLTT